MLPRAIPAALLLFTLLTACSPGEPPAEPAAKKEDPESAALDRANAAADALGGSLMQRLVDELAEKGPVGAIEVCSEVAQRIAAEHSTEGLSVRRVSLKARNPADEPDAFDREKLQLLHTMHDEGRLPPEIHFVVSSGNGRVLRYLRPITIAPPCLQCHGDPAEIPPAVLEIIDERYPGDQARGYKEGDLRGAISVIVELP